MCNFHLIRYVINFLLAVSTAGIHLRIFVDCAPFFMDENEDLIGYQDNNKYIFDDKASTKDLSNQDSFKKRGWEAVDFRRHRNKKTTNLDYDNPFPRKRAWEGLDLYRRRDQLPISSKRDSEGMDLQYHLTRPDDYKEFSKKDNEESINNDLVVKLNPRWNYSNNCSCCSGIQRQLICCLACPMSYTKTEEKGVKSSKDKLSQIKEAACQCCISVGIDDFCHLCKILS